MAPSFPFGSMPTWVLLTYGSFFHPLITTFGLLFRFFSHPLFFPPRTMGKLFLAGDVAFLILLLFSFLLPSPRPPPFCLSAPALLLSFVSLEYYSPVCLVVVASASFFFPLLALVAGGLRVARDLCCLYLFCFSALSTIFVYSFRLRAWLFFCAPFSVFVWALFLLLALFQSVRSWDLTFCPSFLCLFYGPRNFPPFRPVGFLPGFWDCFLIFSPALFGVLIEGPPAPSSGRPWFAKRG